MPSGLSYDCQVKLFVPENNSEELFNDELVIKGEFSKSDKVIKLIAIGKTSSIAIS